ncbi:pyridoxamine 5'-phosphate oxidase family protein [Curvivirga sp.]|uniref:pyridoxamine 5'-phosphate oxidase family protein n=1 Tax=Curvivirga sp. TaxID=2856848 RepID=UPI003B5A91F6
MAKIDTVEGLLNLYGEASQVSTMKQLAYLDEHCAKFISLSPFVVMGTSAKEGLGDVSPRGDHPGFVKILDSETIILPDRPGNRRLDNLRNIIENPVVSFLFLIPGVDETLRINGIAEIRDDEDLRDLCVVDGKLPATVLKVSVKEAYLHCPKAFMRSGLWDPASQIVRSELPTLGKMIKDQTNGEAPVQPHDEMIARFKSQLY